ncbi:Oxaloacetate decarboxylase protein [Dioscorea alata]|uniref:Oxaloacetate decarboxylase protein n=1 Tax=Dioscorea alata TaxID=55571 RepID=A0ACB7UIU9_DIOAL|nr:Oxaloacetate decarboxylase protein [Dioscorea alata]
MTSYCSPRIFSRMLLAQRSLRLSLPKRLTCLCSLTDLMLLQSPSTLLRPQKILHRVPGEANVAGHLPHVGMKALVSWPTLSAHPRRKEPQISLRQIASMATTELCDSNALLLTKGDVRVLPPIFNIYGHRRAFSGPIVTVKVFEDNVLVRELLESPGDGRVLIIDGGGSMRCALLGGNLAQIAQNMGWAGILVNGCIRDVDEINGCDVGIRALASHPQKSYKKRVGEKHVPVNIGGIIIHDSEWLYADSDGILISKTELSI